MKRRNNNLVSLLLFTTINLVVAGSLYAQGGRPPDRETMWFDGNIVNITASDWLPQSAPLKVQTNVFVVVYPIGWEDLGLAPPQCNPCDHAGNGIGFDDFHDHVLDSVPGSPGYTGLRHVNVILPNYSFLAGPANPARDAAITVAYASRLPTTSEAAVNDLLNAAAQDGSPLAIKIDAGFYIRLSAKNKAR
jgi:hypothetical protein